MMAEKKEKPTPLGDHDGRPLAKKQPETAALHKVCLRQQAEKEFDPKGSQRLFY